MTTKIEVELHSTEQTAVEATSLVLSQAPLNSVLIEEDGKFYIVTDNPGFIEFAVEHQGYVKRLVRKNAT